MNDRLADLNDLTKAALKAEWETCFGHPPPARVRRDFLIRNLAWQRQAAQHGGLSKKAERQTPPTRRRLCERPQLPAAGRPPPDQTRHPALARMAG